MWCPRCNKQYNTADTVCIQCGCELEDYTPILTDDQRDLLDTDDEQETSQVDESMLSEELTPELLVTVVGKKEAERLVVLLDGVKIPSLCRRSQEDFFLADEAESEEQEELYDLLVPSMMIRKAMRVLEEDAEGQEETILEEEMLEQLNQTEESEAEGEPAARRGFFFGLFGKK